MSDTISGEKRDAIVEMLARRPAVSFSRIADFYGVTSLTVQRISQANGFSSRGRAR